MAPSERGLALIEIISVLVGLATIAVALRILARIKKVGFGIDDYLSFISLLLLYSMFIELVLCKAPSLQTGSYVEQSLQLVRVHHWGKRKTPCRVDAE